MSQQRAKAVVVKDRAGLRGLIETTHLSRANNGQVLVHLENGRSAFVPVDALLMQDDGSFTLPFSFSELDARATQEAEPGPRDGVAPAGRADGFAPRGGGGMADERVVVPVVAKEARVVEEVVV
ncbi:MAG TPA: hypothetical protein VEQ42_04640, partial [Pyrinomonadaceae bacterium]|nr:hypothetical protein [Pyrinomonadaceae bacterium]